jgi:hypothetical protein
MGRWQWASHPKEAIKGIGSKKGEANKALTRAYARGHIMADARSGHVSYTTTAVGSGRVGSSKAEASQRVPASPVTNFLFMLLVRTPRRPLSLVRG